MIAFLGHFVAFTALFLVCALPAAWAARRRRRPSTIRNFAIAAVVCGLVCAATVASGRILEERCFEAGSRQCDDAGGAAARVMLIVAFVGVSLVRTRDLARR
ncbi:MAG: hypothetical protein AAF962_03435 [Actinomycetota bacterium]